MAAVWRKVVQLAYARRPLIKTWIDCRATARAPKAATFSLGFAPDQKTVMESLARPANRSFLEALLKEITGTDWTLKLSLVEGLPPACAAGRNCRRSRAGQSPRLTMRSSPSRTIR